MAALLRKLMAPFLSLLFLMLGNGFFVTFTSLNLRLRDVSPELQGYVNAAYYAGFLLGAARIEGYISRVRHIRAFAAFAGILTAATMLQGLISEPLFWIFIRFIAGLSIAALYIVIESWFLVISPDNVRGRVLAMYMVALYSAQASSQFILLTLDTLSLEPFLICGLLGSLAIVPVSLTKTAVPELHDPMPGAIWKILKKSPLGVLGCLFSGVILSAIYSFFPNIALKFDLPPSNVMFITIFGGFVFQWPLGYLSDIFDRRMVLTFTALCAALVASSASFTGNDHYLIYLTLFVIGGLAFTLYPMSITQACDRLQPDHLTSATGALLLSYGVGAVIGPLLVPYFLKFDEYYGIFYCVGFFSLVLAIVGVASMLLREAVPQEDQGHYIPIQPASSPVVLEMDPRAEEYES